ncbi:hypothetical protein MKX03_007791, partial [Papaver bracteatum]
EDKSSTGSNTHQDSGSSSNQIENRRCDCDLPCKIKMEKRGKFIGQMSHCCPLK